LDYDAGVTFGWRGAFWWAEVEPVDFALLDVGYHRSRMVERNLAFMFGVVMASASGWFE
jgi:hypothetical protein